jgi:uncharacterized phage protein gp47/JayE
MLFKKNFSELVQDSLAFLSSNTRITNVNVGGITRSIIEILNRNVADYYSTLDLNMAMSFLSTAEGYYLDLIGSLFNVSRVQASPANATASDNVQKFYVVSGYLNDVIPYIPAGASVSSEDGTVRYTVSSNVNFSGSATEVYVSISSTSTGSKVNVPAGVLTLNDLNIAGLFTTNVKSIVSGTDTESDSNYRYRISNATLSAEKANEIAIRLAALSVNGVADVLIKKYARGIGTYDMIVIPTEGVAGDSLVSSVQTAIDAVTAYGIKGTAIKPTIIPVEIEVRIIFMDAATDFQRSQIRSLVRTSIERYIVNITIGGEFILNELRQQIMDVSPLIKDHVISCYYFKEEPVFMGNVSSYWDELFYPDPKLSDAIRVI